MKKEFFDVRWYPSFSDNWDDHLFRSAILGHLGQYYTLLDLGAGAGIVEAMNFKNECREVVGVDLDPRVTSNPFLHKGIEADASNLPLPDAYFDVVIADNVMEHIDDPEKTLTEIARVLKPGGSFFFKTPNKYHYMPVIANMTPHWFHAWVNGVRGRDAVDTFPTRYKLNSKRSVKRLSQKVGFEVKTVTLIEGRPEYLRFSSVTYLIGMLYERVVNSSKIFESLRILMIVELVKPSE